MIQDDISALQAFLSAVYDVVDLIGNRGKLVYRVLEQYFPNGIFDLVLHAPVELTPFQFAAYLAAIAEGCEFANDYASAVAKDVLLAVQVVRMHFRSEVVDVGRRSYRLLIEPEHIPQTMRGRQAFLRTASYCVDSVVSLSDMRYLGSSPQDLEESFFGRLYKEDESMDTEESRDQVRQAFDALLRQDYSNITTISVAVVDLAALIAPEVSEALRSAIEGVQPRKVA